MERKIKSFLIVLLVISYQLGYAQTQSKKNIVIIMADDLDSKQLGCYGGKNVQTPNIDALAKEGLKFDNLICSEAICVPTRASLFTGLYPVRHGAYKNHQDITKNIGSIGKYLRALNYDVALVGKAHATKPQSVFQFNILKDADGNGYSGRRNYWTNAISKYVSETKNPFCLFVMSDNPHTQWIEGNPADFNPKKLIMPSNWIDNSTTRSLLCQYLACIKTLDNQVGNLVDILKKKGIYDQTLFIFLGEQGAGVPGAKWTLYDDGVKSSMIARLPGYIKPETTTPALIQYEDITPTLIDFVGGKPIPGLDGTSFLNVLKGETNVHRQYAYGIYNNIPEGKAYPIRSIRTLQYKLIHNLTPDSLYYNTYMWNLGRHTEAYLMMQSWLETAKKDMSVLPMIYRYIKRPEYELYDIEKDPRELNNLIYNSDYKDVAEKLKTELTAWMKSQGDPGASLDVQTKK